MAINKLVVNGLTFTEEKIKSGSVFLSNSISFDELGIDTLDMEIDLSEETGTIFAPADADGLLTSDNRLFTVHPYFHILSTDPTQFTYGKRVEYYRDNVIFSAFYMSSIRRVSKYFYAISCISAIGLLDGVRHYGGLYTGQTMAAVLQEIIGSTFPYSVAANVQNIRVYGWLPVSTCRDNLRQLLFANGVAIKKSNNGNVSFELLNTSVPFQIPDNRIMLGGSVDYPVAASEAVVVEHSFFSTGLDETVTLYDGTVSASTFVSPQGVLRNGILVTFEEPCHSLSAEGVTILESGVNYAVLSAGGHATLTGKKYTHTTREVRQTMSQGSGMVGSKNVARVEEATLVNAINSEAVTSRVASYYSSSRKVKAKFLANTERPGDFVAFNNPFHEMDEGLIASMDINISSTLLADTEFVADYTPVSGGTYENVVLLTGSGRFQVPAGKTKLHVVLFGGGQGGYSGKSGKLSSPGTIKDIYDGYWNTRSKELTTGEGGDGGEAGEGGHGGSIYQTTLDVTPLSYIDYSCGVGGAGGVSVKDRSVDDPPSVPGAYGSASVFGALSSAAGSPSDFGYMDIISGNIYGGVGNRGVAGGKGGGYLPDSKFRESQTPGPPIIYNGVAYYGGPNNLEIVSSESTALLGYDENNRPLSYNIAAGGMYGAGGGAAAGRNGNKSTDPPSGYARASKNTSNRVGNGTGGAGGTGADAISPPKESRYGVGGKGGNGGGGQGGAGAAAVDTSISGYGHGTDPGMPSNLSLKQNTAAGRGLGSNGGVGGDGCILVYY